MSTLLDFLLRQCDRFKRARLPSLYSDFAPQRSSNPDGFAANVAAWQEGLGTAARAGVLSTGGGSTVDTLSLESGEALLQALETNEWGRPLALGSVIDESLSSHHLVPFQEFIKAPRTIHSRSWKAQPWWFLSWGLRQLGVIDSSTAAGSLPTGQFVVVANVEQAVSKVFEQMAAWTSQVDRIHPMEMFREEAGSAMGLDGRISDSDLAILLAVLSRDKGAIVHDSEAVKFRVPGDQSTTLSAEDRTIASLKLLITNLSGQVSHLLKRIRVLTATAREAVGRKDRISALTALKSRKLTENTLAQRTDTLSQVEGVLHQIEQAHDQVTMIKVMKDSTSVLHNLRTQTGGVEEVEQIVEDLRDEMQQVDEIGNAIEASEESNAVDDDTVNAELEQIMQQAQTLKEENEAHGTQQRLAEIENTMANMPQPTKTGQVSVDDGIVALKGLSLNEESARPDQFESASNG